MKKIILYGFLIISLSNVKAQGLSDIQEKISTVIGKDVHYYLQLGNQSFNERRFTKAEEHFLKALEVLHNDQTLKAKDINNYAVGELTIYESLMEVNEGLKDKADSKKYKEKLKLLEKEYARSPTVDISYYFEKKARAGYNGKEYTEAIRMIDKAIMSCRDNHRKKTLDQFKQQALTYHYFQKKRYTEALKKCNEQLNQDTNRNEWLDLRGRILYALGKTTEACKDWESAYALNNPKAKLRQNRYCR